MSRTIQELTPGTIVMVDELSSGETASAAYIYVKQSDDGAASLLLRATALLSKQMNSTNVAEYQDSAMDTWLSSSDSGFLDTYLPTDVQNTLVSSQMSYYSVANESLITITRMVRLATYTEVGFSSSYDEGTSFLSALKTWADTTTDNTARICYNSAGAAVSWWLASPYSESQYRAVGTGGAAYNYNVANSSYVRPVLSVSPDTIVSDETEDTIYLLPDSSKLYREVDATVYLGSSEKRPNTALLNVELTNLYDTVIEVSNNAKDESPAWVEIENGGTAELTNATKETDNWELGVHIYGKSGGLGKVGEPVVVVLTDSE